MDQKISIARPADEVFAYLADPSHLGDWLPQLRREESLLPEGGLQADRQGRSIRWSFDPPGEWHVAGDSHGAVLTLRLERTTAPAVDPTTRETPQQAAANSAEAALQSLKSHLEHAGGGDPDLHGGDAPARVFGRGATEDSGR